MTQNTLNDNSSGDVVITPGSSGSGGGGGGFFSIGGGGGFGGGFGGSSRRRRKKRAQARAAALAQARAAEQARQEAAARAHAEMLAVAHRQRVQSYGQAREVRRAQLDAHFDRQAQDLANRLQQEIDAARKAPRSDFSERWALYLITKARNEIDGLITAKQQILADRQALAATFTDHGMSAEAYAARLEGLADALQMQQLQQAWEAAYAAAHEGRLLQEAVEQLSQRSAALLAEHAQQEQLWRAREAKWEQQRQYAEQREARIRFKEKSDEDHRLQRLKVANTLAAPIAAAQSGGVLLTQAGAQLGAELASVIGQAIADAAKEVGRVAAIRLGQTVSLTATALLYSPVLGDGELSAVQRQRLLEGVGVGAEVMGVAPGQDLQAIADAGGTASVEHRIKIEHLPGGSAIAVATTGAGVDASVRVRNAVFDALTETYRVDAESLSGKSIVFGAPSLAGDQPGTGRVYAPASEVEVIGNGVDLRFDDCIVCIPGVAPQYFSFVVSPAGTGIANGNGETAGAGWWGGSVAEAGVGLPSQVGNRLRGHAFSEFSTFERLVWRAIAAEQGLLRQFDEINQRRILSGYPPIAAKDKWSGEQRAFQLRHLAAAGVESGLYDLDRLRIHAPDSALGVRSVVQPFEPWFASSLALAFDAAVVEGQPPRLWTPLVPPGRELLGPTPLPPAPPVPGTLPGGPLDPVKPNLEVLPGGNPGEIGAIIPGFGGDTELPQPGLVNNEPAKPLEVGEYKDLRRRSINDQMDVDHIVSRKALERRLRKIYAGATVVQLKVALESAPSVVIPEEIHRKYSETYGRRNSVEQQIKDASDLRAAVDANIDTLKPGLLDYGFSESDIESARQKLHELHSQKGHY